MVCRKQSEIAHLHTQKWDRDDGIIPEARLLQPAIVSVRHHSGPLGTGPAIAGHLKSSFHLHYTSVTFIQTASRDVRTGLD